jgi:hypothetical protein
MIFTVQVQDHDKSWHVLQDTPAGVEIVLSGEGLFHISHSLGMALEAICEKFNCKIVTVCLTESDSDSRRNRPVLWFMALTEERKAEVVAFHES